MSAAVIVLFFALAILGIPLAFAFGLVSVAGLYLADFPMQVLAEKMMHSVNSFPLMAIPFFMLAGELMVSGGVMQRLIDFANVLVGRFRGGLAQVTVVSGMGMASVSGAAIADATALSAILFSPMARSYGKPFSAGLIAATANLGPILPPSTAMIIYATLAGPTVSVTGMFLAGIVPGVIIGLAMMAAISVIARSRNFAITGEPFSFDALYRNFRRAFIVLLMPVVVIGGIVYGVFTATEGGAIAVAYAFFVGFFINRELRVADLWPALLNAAITTAIIGTIIAFASTVTFLFTIDLVPQRIAEALTGFTSEPLVMLLLVMIILIVVGMFLEPNSAYVMLVPIFAPMALAFGVDPLHFAMVFVLNLVIGMLTPPVGTLLFVMCAITGLRMGELFRQVWPFALIQFAVMLLILFFPSVALWLPRLLGF